MPENFQGCIKTCGNKTPDFVTWRHIIAACNRLKLKLRSPARHLQGGFSNISEIVASFHLRACLAGRLLSPTSKDGNVYAMIDSIKMNIRQQ
jgi:hypothetical protein